MIWEQESLMGLVHRNLMTQVNEFRGDTGRNKQNKEEEAAECCICKQKSS